MTRSWTCWSVSCSASQSLSVVAHPVRNNFGLLCTCCGQIPAAIAAAIIAIFVLLFANPKCELDFRSAILYPLKISYLVILLNVRRDRIVRINFGLSSFAVISTTDDQTWIIVGPAIRMSSDDTIIAEPWDDLRKIFSECQWARSQIRSAFCCVTRWAKTSVWVICRLVKCRTHTLSV